MNALDPAVRDLLVAMYGVLDAPDANYAAAAVQTAIHSLLQDGDPEALTNWILAEPRLAEASDALRVRTADVLALVDERLPERAR